MATILSTSLLSVRETTVLHLLAWGFTNKEIADRLAISVKTVEAHKANGMRKLHLSTRSSLVRQAVEWGWLTLDREPGDDTDVPLPAVRRTGQPALPANS